MRAVLAAVAVVIAFYSVVAVPVVGAMVVTPAEWWEGRTAIISQTCVLFLGTLTASSLFVGLGWADLDMLGIRKPGKNMRGFGAGLLIGVLMACGAIGFALMGGARLSLASGTLSAFLTSAFWVGLVLLAAALAEELLFRGYPIAALARAIGKFRASLVLAVLFMAAHSMNPEATVFGLLNIGLAALLLSAAFFGPGGIAAAWGLHVGWNGGLGILADAPVSGVQFQMPVVEYASGGPEWFTGGSFGPEGGMVSTIAMMAALAWLLRNRETSERMI